MEFYYVTESYRLYSTAYGEITKEKLRKDSVKLSDYNGDILIGAKIRAW